MDDNDLQLARVDEIAAIPVDEQMARMSLIGSFLDTYARQIEAIARRLTSYYRMYGRYEEIHSLVMNTAFDELLKVHTPGEIHSWAGWLSNASAKALNRMLDDENDGGMSGVGTRQRRRRAMAQTRSRMASALGYDPSDEDVVETYNARIHTTHARPDKHGAIGTVADMQPMLAGEITETHCATATAAPASIICIETVEAIIDACARQSEDVARVAEQWLTIHEGVLDIEERPKVLAETTGLSIRKVPGLLAEARAIAITVVQDRTA